MSVSLKDVILEDINRLSEMSVKEYTLYRKWSEIQSKYPPNKNTVGLFFNNNTGSNLPPKLNHIKSKIWLPSSPDYYKDIQPKVIQVENKEQAETWEILRTFTHTGHWNKSVGRFLRFIVMNEVDDSYIGVISIGSDFITLGARDSHIGWTKEHKIDNGKLRCTAMGSSISPTQPLGYNFVGGKLIALMTCSDVVENAWNRKYQDETLAGITTTSLYGSYSQYTRLKHWRKCGTTEGKINLEPSDSTFALIRDYVREEHREEFDRILNNVKTKSGILSHPKTRMLGFAYSKLGVKNIPENKAPRGIFWCELYENSNRFLRMEDDKLGKKRFDNTVISLTKLWKEKYASKRIKNVIKNDKYSLDSLFYDGMIGKTWEETKETYLKDVGR